MEQCFNKYMCKIDRLSAWGLLFVMIAYFISGYGMTKGLIPADKAVRLHNEILPLFAAVFFVVHTSYAVHLSFKRWRIWNIFTKALLIIVYVAFIGGFIYVDRFYQTPTSAKTAGNIAPTVAMEDDEDDDDENELTSTKTTTTNPGVNNVKTFTLAELAQYDGLNGNAPYVAVDGIVYDMTGVFKNGYHFGHKAGTELSDAFYLKHAKSAITKYPVVGELK